jgi:FtsH-binding integral membrane protein
MSGSDPVYTFLPLALAALTTAVIFGVQQFVGLFFDRDQSFQQGQSISKGANQ